MRIPASVLRSWSLLTPPPRSASILEVGGVMIGMLTPPPRSANTGVVGAEEKAVSAQKAESSDEDESERHHGGASGEAFD